MSFDTKDQRLEDILEFAERLLLDLDEHVIRWRKLDQELDAYKRGLTRKQWEREKQDETQSDDRI